MCDVCSPCRCAEDAFLKGNRGMLNLFLGWGFMLLSIAEGVLLDRARAEGLVTDSDVEAAQKERSRGTVERKWGPVLDVLIAHGKITDDTVRKLRDSLTEKGHHAEQSALDRTVDGSLGQTLQSEVQGAALTQSPQQTFPVPHWDKYEFLELLGRGGMGAVYKAHDRRLGRTVALKFIHGNDPGITQRFLQEARSQARLEHPYICKVYEVGTVDGKPYIAMEFIDGQTLDRAASRMELAEKIALLKETSLGLHAAHAQGIIHRDIKPSNVMVQKTPNGGLRPVIMDFGLARESGDSHGLTESGAVMGTPAYMSPEQARGEARKLDHRSDVYSLGATLYEVLTGKPPFEDQTALNIMLKVMNDAPTPIRQRNPALPESLELVVSKCLNKEPEKRYQTALELAEDLGRFLSSQKVAAKRLSYSYRLWYWARNNRTLASLATALLCSVLAGAGFGIRARFLAIQKERRAKQQAELSRWIGQGVKDLEWVARTAFLLPLHDAGEEKQLVRERMAEIETELQRHPDIGPPLLAYARGRGFLALHKWKDAEAELRRAEQLGYVDLELDYAQGRALGALYSEALEEARKSGDKSFFEKRKAELDQELLKPAITHLERSRGLRTVSTAYVEGLIAYFQERREVALSRAEQAHKQAPWLYEAVLLTGDVFLAQARNERDSGAHDAAEQSFAKAVARYKQAAEVGRSDAAVYEALSEAYIRWEELDYFRGKNPDPHLNEALAAADKALLADPKESRGHTKRAFAYYFYGDYAKQRLKPQDVLAARTEQLKEGLLAIAAHPDDSYAHDTTGTARFRLAEIRIGNGQPVGTLLTDAYANFAAATTLNPRFPWAYNDHAIALLAEAKQLQQQNRNPLLLIRQAVQLAEKALDLDPKYIYALNTLVLASLRACTWQTEHGQDPGPWVSQGLSAAQRALALNPKYSFAWGNIGSLSLLHALYLAQANQDASPAVQTSLAAYQSMVVITGPSVEIQSLRSVAFHVLAAQQVERKVDPTDSIQLGLAALEKCDSPPISDPYCIDAVAKFSADQAAWQKAQGKDDLATLQQAMRWFEHALSKMPNDETDSLLSGAETVLKTAESLHSHGKPPTPVLQVGHTWIDRALEFSQGIPRALALRGAFKAVEARAERNERRAKTLLQASQQSLLVSFGGNPLLKRKYGRWLEEVEGRLGGAPGEPAEKAQKADLGKR